MLNTENGYNICVGLTLYCKSVTFKSYARFWMHRSCQWKKNTTNTIHSTKSSLKCLRNSWTRRMGTVPMIFLCYKSPTFFDIELRQIFMYNLTINFAYDVVRCVHCATVLFCLYLQFWSEENERRKRRIVGWYVEVKTSIKPE